MPTGNKLVQAVSKYSVNILHTAMLLAVLLFLLLRKQDSPIVLETNSQAALILIAVFAIFYHAVKLSANRRSKKKYVNVGHIIMFLVLLSGLLYGYYVSPYPDKSIVLSGDVTYSITVIVVVGLLAQAGAVYSKYT